MSAGWKLDRDDRAWLLVAFTPRYAEAVADHVTFPGGEAPAPASVCIIGRADDGAGVEAMVVEVDGGTTRPDGNIYHITWSLGDGREARESNQVIAATGWQPLDGGAVRAEPARW